jgi:hypothetical protein
MDQLQECQKAESKNEVHLKFMAVPLTHFLQQPTSSTKGKQRKPTDKWEIALRLALECVEKLSKKVTSIEDMERNSAEALMLLATR